MISIIAVIGKNRAIGRRNQLLWNIPEDMKHFRQITTGHTVIMGDKTYFSIGKPLPKRRNIVVTLDKNFQAEGVEICHSLDSVLRKYKNSDEEVFVIGGGQIYQLSLPWADKLYFTIVDDNPIDADTFFPDYSEFKKIISWRESKDENFRYVFCELTR